MSWPSVALIILGTVSIVKAGLGLTRLYTVTMRQQKVVFKTQDCGLLPQKSIFQYGSITLRAGSSLMLTAMTDVLLRPHLQGLLQ